MAAAWDLVRRNQDLVLVKAEELSLPDRGEQIAILGGGDSLNVRVSYGLNIEIPLLQRQIYTKTSEHKVKYHPPL